MPQFPRPQNTHSIENDGGAEHNWLHAPPRSLVSHREIQEVRSSRGHQCPSTGGDAVSESTVGYMQQEEGWATCHGHREKWVSGLSFSLCHGHREKWVYHFHWCKKAPLMGREGYLSTIYGHKRKQPLCRGTKGGISMWRHSGGLLLCEALRVASILWKGLKGALLQFEGQDYWVGHKSMHTYCLEGTKGGMITISVGSLSLLEKNRGSEGIQSKNKSPLNHWI